MGVVVLERLIDTVEDDLPLAFRVLAFVAGTAAGWGQWMLVAHLTRRLARVGARLGGLAAVALGGGFGAGGFFGFLISYFALLFVTPLALVLVGMGLLRTGDLPGWGRLIPFLTAAVAAITYGFHALAKDIWDPSDLVWFIGLGLGWLLLGSAAIAQVGIRRRSQFANR